MDENTYLIDYYSRGLEHGRIASNRALEFITSMRYIERYLKKGDRILDVGAATGRYSHALALMGHQVDALELVELNIDIFKKNTQPSENVTIRQGNAMDLSAFCDDTYNITLIFGPMYHLFAVEDKNKVIEEAMRVTKSGGLIYIAYCMTDCSIIDSGFFRKKFDIFDFIEKGYIDRETFAARSEPALIFELVRKEDIDALIAPYPLTRLHFVAVDGYLGNRFQVEEMDDKYFALFRDYHFATCERADMVGLSAHTLDILRKD